MDQLPAYEVADLPVYSPSSASPSSLRTISTGSSTIARTGANNYTYKSDHLRVNLGPRHWGTRLPAYGFHGIVDGTVQVKKKFSHVLSINATLEGVASLTTTDVGRAALISGAAEAIIVSQDVTLFESETSSKGTSLNGQNWSFSLPFPTYVSGGSSYLPPSYAINQPGAFSDVKYRLRVDVFRQGLHRHELVTIPILYLPQTRPSLPPVLDLAPQYSPEGFSESDRVTVVDISVPKTAEQLYNSKFQLAIPSPKTFAAGEFIPLTLTVSCGQNLTLPQLLLDNNCISIEFVRHSKIWLDSGWISRSTVVSMAELQHLDNSSEGISRSHWVLQAGKPQQESSWQMPCFLAMSYSIRVGVRPPYKKSSVVWGFEERILRVTSDQWLDSVLAEATMDYPALGLINSPVRTIDIPNPRL